MDRNGWRLTAHLMTYGSLSARRAWIEILSDTSDVKAVTVALRKESVDRNFRGMNIIFCTIGRSPQGERG